MPTLSSFCAVEKPLSPFSTRNAVTPFVPRAESTVAYTTETSAVGPFVIHILLPFST